MEGSGEAPPERSKREWERNAQLGVVALSHLSILIGVIGIVAIFGVGSKHGTRVLGVPLGFFLGEAFIVVVCVLLLLSYDWLAGLAQWFRPAWRPFIPLGEWMAARLPRPRVERAARIDRVKGGGLLLCFALQFAALAFLLNATGGPVESPFAQMVLAFAIFTPFLANDNRTIGWVLLLSIVYYAALVELMSTGDGGGASRWAFFCVNGLFAAVGVLISFVDKNNQLLDPITQARGGSSSADEPEPDDQGASDSPSANS